MLLLFRKHHRRSNCVTLFIFFFLLGWISVSFLLHRPLPFVFFFSYQLALDAPVWLLSFRTRSFCADLLLQLVSTIGFSLANWKEWRDFTSSTASLWWPLMLWWKVCPFQRQWLGLLQAVAGAGQAAFWHRVSSQREISASDWPNRMCWKSRGEILGIVEFRKSSFVWNTSKTLSANAAPKMLTCDCVRTIGCV